MSYVVKWIGDSTGGYLKHIETGWASWTMRQSLAKRFTSKGEARDHIGSMWFSSDVSIVRLKPRAKEPT